MQMGQGVTWQYPGIVGSAVSLCDGMQLLVEEPTHSSGNHWEELHLLRHVRALYSTVHTTMALYSIAASDCSSNQSAQPASTSDSHHSYYGCISSPTQVADLLHHNPLSYRSIEEQGLPEAFIEAVKVSICCIDEVLTVGVRHSRLSLKLSR
jgi:hypothetical protein